MNGSNIESKTHLSYGALVGLQLQHEVFVVVESRLDGLQMFLSETVEREEMILGLQQPTEDLLHHVSPGRQTQHLLTGDHPDRGFVGGDGVLRVTFRAV